MKLVKMFNNNQIRVIIKNHEPFFAVIDLCNILELSNVSQAISYLNTDDLITNEVIDRLKRKQIATFVNEGGLYQLIFRSRKPEAKEFQKWVTHEVLPSIRKTGKYSIPEKVKQLSTDKRNALTDEWQEHGITKPHEFVRLTLQEYNALGFDKGKRKADLSRGDLLLLSALESMEMLKLFNDQDINGYNDCKDSLTQTAKDVKLITDKKGIDQ